MEEELAKILPICEIAEEFAPEYDCEKVYESFYERFPDAFAIKVISEA